MTPIREICSKCKGYTIDSIYWFCKETGDRFTDEPGFAIDAVGFKVADDVDKRCPNFFQHAVAHGMSVPDGGINAK